MNCVIAKSVDEASFLLATKRFERLSMLKMMISSIIARQVDDNLSKKAFPLTYDDGGFVCAGVAVGFVSWRFINNLKPDEYAIKNIGTTIGLTVGGVAAKYLQSDNKSAAPSYFYGLVIGIVAYNVWGVIWRRALKDANPELIDATNQLRIVNSDLKAAVASLQEASRTEKPMAGQ